MTSVGVLKLFTAVDGEYFSYSALFQGEPFKSHSGNQSSSVDPYHERKSYRPIIDAMALKRLVWPSNQFIM